MCEAKDKEIADLIKIIEEPVTKPRQVNRSTSYSQPYRTSPCLTCSTSLLLVLLLLMLAVLVLLLSLLLRQPSDRPNFLPQPAVTTIRGQEFDVNAAMNRKGSIHYVVLSQRDLSEAINAHPGKLSALDVYRTAQGVDDTLLSLVRGPLSCPSSNLQ